jgi:hypothetical protein
MFWFVCPCLSLRVSFHGKRGYPHRDRVSPYGDKVSPYGEKVSPYGEKVSPYGEKVSPCGDKVSPYGDRVCPYRENAVSGAKIAYRNIHLYQRFFGRRKCTVFILKSNDK